MEAPQRSLALSQLTGGYFTRSKENPETAPQDSTPIALIPRDVLFYIFNMLPKATQARCARVCQQWHRGLKTEEHFYKAQFMARYNILKCCCFYGMVKDQDLLLRAQNFLENPEFYKFPELEIPDTTYRMKTAVEKFFAKPKVVKNTLLVDIQKLLETQISKSTIMSFRDFSAPRFNLTTDDHYELQAYYDCLRPILRIVAEHIKKISYGEMNAILETPFTKPMLTPIFEMVFKCYSEEEMTLRFNNPHVENPNQLEVLNYVLPRVKLAALRLTTFPNTPFSWIGGEGLAALKNGLVKATHITYLHFKEMINLIDAANGRALADIVTTRQARHPKHAFETILIGDNSVTLEGLQAFIQGLKNYPVPIVIYVMQAGNGIRIMDDESTKDLCRVNKMLNLRFRTSEPLGSTYYAFTPDFGGMMCGYHIDQMKKIEKARNKS